MRTRKELIREVINENESLRTRLDLTMIYLENQIKETLKEGRYCLEITNLNLPPLAFRIITEELKDAGYKIEPFLQENNYSIRIFC